MENARGISAYSLASAAGVVPDFNGDDASIKDGAPPIWEKKFSSTYRIKLHVRERKEKKHC